LGPACRRLIDHEGRPKDRTSRQIHRFIHKKRSIRNIDRCVRDNSVEKAIHIQPIVSRDKEPARTSVTLRAHFAADKASPTKSTSHRRFTSPMPFPLSSSYRAAGQSEAVSRKAFAAEALSARPMRRGSSPTLPVQCGVGVLSRRSDNAALSDLRVQFGPCGRIMPDTEGTEGTALAGAKPQKI
jgi:hypothetical protein